ncbi:DUF3859 domain-containing protein [Saccharobesus litoralis]|uniref:DUF3859 domain-containing protein n=1 Tax=Saccharobesus litoralis TaxID=2172099 RepID=A0A2S0VW47_9ALTE|nr:DUF3859 domain-containing protein [Saccharobesus litoralis]AWB68415.1 DUF3859 domain-containing protein [Saccharobesus litoralis]
MSKLKSVFTIVSHGIYTKWDERSKALPKIRNFTTQVPAEEDIEFGFILNAQKAKGKKLDFTIFHPNIPDEDGDIMPPFTGSVHVRNNNWDFYLGDTLWLPLENKQGDWRMVIEHNGQIIAEKTFNVALEQPNNEAMFWKRRGF